MTIIPDSDKEILYNSIIDKIEKEINLVEVKLSAYKLVVSELHKLPHYDWTGIYLYDNNEEMLNLLELRLAKGEIDLETYKKLSRKYEAAPKHGVTPQQQRLLPPAPAAQPVVKATTPTVAQPTVTATPVTPTPTPTVAAKPEVKAQPSTAPQPQVQTPTPISKKPKIKE